MTKTLWCEKERANALDMPTYTKVTATKVDEIEEGKLNEYMDAEGNRYIVRYNSFKRRDEFVRIK